MLLVGVFYIVTVDEFPGYCSIERLFWPLTITKPLNWDFEVGNILKLVDWLTAARCDKSYESAVVHFYSAILYNTLHIIPDIFFLFLNCTSPIPIIHFCTTPLSIRVSSRTIAGLESRTGQSWPSGIWIQLLPPCCHCLMPLWPLCIVPSVVFAIFINAI